MPHSLISRNADLQRLVDEGYEVDIQAKHLVITGVPYVNASREVRRGTLVSDLQLNGDRTVAPSQHVAWFIGEYPCSHVGQRLTQLVHQEQQQQFAPGFGAPYGFSHKPPNGYRDYHEKMTRYMDILGAHAAAIDPTATAKTFKPIAASPENSVFHYVDTATSRAGIGVVSAKLEGHHIAIIGLGGTGSYILDLVAKTPVAAIHLFDRDEFLQHNAFRAPGAPSLDQLLQRETKVQFLANVYSRMRREIIPHPEHITDANVQLLATMTFVFVCIDSGPARRMIFDALTAARVPFIDAGIGVELVDDALWGIVRVTTGTSSKHDHLSHRVSCGQNDDANQYSTNIQVADLNALNATLAVIRWKKFVGFYHDDEREHYSSYTTAAHQLTSEER